LYASLDWLPSLVGGGLAGCGFCLVWYRLRRLERHYQRLDEDAQAPRCQVCRRWLFAETLAACVRLDDDAKREHCPSCGGYNGPTLKSDDHDPPPVPVAEDDAQTQKIVIVSDEDSTDPPPGCPDCGRTFFAESLAFYKALDDDDKRDDCPSCGGHNGPEPKDDDDPPPPPPVPVAIAEPAPSLPKLAVVREDDLPPIPVAIQEPAPSLLRLYKSHPEHCDCDVCLFNRRIAMDVAQAQTLGLHEDLRSLRQGLKTLRLTLTDEIDYMSRQIARHIGAET
jgi:hypothetical protein